MTTLHPVCFPSICGAVFAYILVGTTACSDTHRIAHASTEDAEAAEDSQPIVVVNSPHDGACSEPVCDDAGRQVGSAEASANGLGAAANASDDAGSPACASGTLPCGTGCVPSDDYNCGACGHACAPGACSGGRCQRWAVAKADSSVLSLARVTIATDGVNVVWLDPALGVAEAPVDPATPIAEPVVLAPPTTGTNSSAPRLGQIAIANGVVAWTVSDTDLGLETWTALEGQAGSGSRTNVTGMVGCTGWGVALSSTGTAVYFNSECTQGANLLGCNLGGADGCSPLGVTNPAASSSNGNDVAVTSNEVFVTDSANGALWRYDVQSGTFSQIEAGQGDPFLLTVDPSFVYWASQGPNLMFTVSRTSQINPESPPEPVIGATGGVVTGIATDGTDLYFSGAVTTGSTRVGVIARVPVTGGPHTNLYASADMPLAVATAGGVVVWLDGTDLGVYAVRP